MPRPKVFLESRSQPPAWTGAELTAAYDGEGYGSMNQDGVRNAVYRKAIERAVRGGRRNFVEIGPGASALLTSMVLGARVAAEDDDDERPRVVAAEANPKSAAAALQLLRADPANDGRVAIYTGLSSEPGFLQRVAAFCDADAGRPPEALLQEVFGFLASSEGVVRAVAELQEPLFAPLAAARRQTPWYLPSLAASFGVPTLVRRPHLMHNAEVKLARSFALVRRLAFVRGSSSADGADGAEAPGKSVQPVTLPALVPGAGAGSGCLAAPGSVRIQAEAALPNCFPFEFYDFSAPLAPQMRQARVARFLVTEACVVNSLSFFLWVGFADPPDARLRRGGGGGGAGAGAGAGGATATDNSASETEGLLSSLLVPGTPTAASTSSSLASALSGAGLGGGAGGGAGAGGGGSSSVASTPMGSSAAKGGGTGGRKRRRSEVNLRVTGFPYGCAGLLPPAAADAVAHASFSSCNVDGDACSSNWRNLVVWLPGGPQELAPGCTLVVASDVDVSEPSPRYRLRVEVLPPVAAAVAAAPGGAAGADGSSSSAAAAPPLYAADIALPQLYPFFEAAEASSDEVIDSWLDGRALMPGSAAASPLPAERAAAAAGGSDDGACSGSSSEAGSTGGGSAVTASASETSS